MSSEPTFAVLGAGSWGTALALHLSRQGIDVVMWSRDHDQVTAMDAAHCNQKYLPGFDFPASLNVTADLKQAMQADVVLMNVPSRAFEALAGQMKPFMKDSTQLLTATKGLSSQSEMLTAVVKRVLGSNDFAVLSGPSFAKEVAAELPTAVNIASENAAYAKRLATIFSTHSFRVYTNSDVVGVQLGGALKNVLAVAVGVSDGLGFGANARSALITRGLAEMMRFAETFGAKAETLMGLSGLGDLILTCTDNQSRNRRFGLAIGKGLSLVEARASIAQEVESIHTVEQVFQLAQTHKIDMPITEQVHVLLSGAVSPEEAVKRLFSRALRSE
jgi:glycerol-3-phosphate dehydrogenase (NAD(P)+)